MTTSKQAQRVTAAVQAVLPLSAEARVVRSDGELVTLDMNGQRLTAYWVGEGTLGRVRKLLDGRKDFDVVVGRRMSPGAKAQLADAGIGWVDELGDAEIVSGPMLISRSGRTEVRAQKDPPWTPSVIAVAEALLAGERNVTVSSIAEETSLSRGSASHALRVLQQLGYLDAEERRGPKSGRRVSDRDGLLDAYVEAALESFQPSLSVGMTWQDLLDGIRSLVAVFKRARLDWALTGQVAARVLAPLVTTVRSGTLYVDASNEAQLDEVARRVGLRPIEGGRLTLKPFPTETTRRLSSEVDGLWVAPWPRVFADLQNEGVRGEEAAEHLREVVDG